MTPQELKNSILQLAIQGKLVEQRPEEGIAQELYAQIQAEKQRLIKEGKLKKEKPLPEITEDEKPFDTPEGWMWVRLGDIFQHNTGKALNTSNRIGTSLTYITTSNLYWNRFELNHLKEMFFSESEIEKCTVRKNDLLVCEGGDFGRTAIWRYDDEIRIQNHIHRLRPFGEIDIEYFYYLFYLYKFAGWINGKGIGIQGLSSKAIHILAFPLPPLAEQHRIVAKIEELLPLVDRYEQAWTKLEDFNRRFPEDLKKSILQQAIQGKLVEQRPEEGTAQELYEQIQAEKRRLVKEGKIKKEKPLPEITEEEKPFEIPEGWMWVRLSNLMNEISTGPFGSMLHKSDYVKNGIPLVNPANIIQGKIVPSEKMMISKDTAERLKSYILHTGMIVIGRRGEMGRCAIISENENGWVCGTGSFFLTPGSALFVQYIQTLFSTQYAKKYLGGESVGTTMNNLNHNILKKMPFPLPPLAEQKRIVERLEELLTMCERLSTIKEV